MSFSLPSFPITCNIWSTLGSAGYAFPRLSNVPCNLAVGGRITGQVVVTAGSTGLIKLVLLLPALTDIRSESTAVPSPDLVECPAGSKRFYIVHSVDDYGKGFDNEHRFAVIQQQLLVASFGFTWPVPMP